MKDAFGRRAHDLRLRESESFVRRALISSRYRFLNLPDECPHAAAAGFIHQCPPFGLTRGLLGRFCICHVMPCGAFQTQADGPRQTRIAYCVKWLPAIDGS